MAQCILPTDVKSLDLSGVEVSNKLEFEKPLEKWLTCPICQHVLQKPMQLSCCHNVCLKCLDEESSEYCRSHLKEICPENIVPCKYNCGVEPMKRKDLLLHDESCSKKPTKCDFKYFGCGFEKSLNLPDDMKSRNSNNESDSKNLQNSSNVPDDVKSRLLIIEQELKDIKMEVFSQHENLKNLDCSMSELPKKIDLEEQGRIICDVREKVDNLILDIKKINGGAAGSQIAMAGQSGVKPRGKIPSCHENILRKHHLSIIQNVKVDDIVDHLFSKNVIDLVEMGVIENLLGSKGNKRALRHLMSILFNSSHTALPTFISCLQQTGYFEIAKCLQENMDSIQQDSCGQGHS